MVMYPIDPNAEEAYQKMMLARRKQLLLGERLIKEMSKDTRAYQSALATGRFDRARKIRRAFSGEVYNPKFPKGMLIKGVETTTPLGSRTISPTNLMVDLTTHGNPNPTSRFRRAINRALHFGDFLERTLRAAGENINSPLLDLFGPIQMNEAMRKTRGSIDRRKYLREDGGA